ncbi:hypothetical protein FNH09_08390 [Streptomyces adustus]|uniref:Uncharacterized protein n=1 Tax=Streptomyces adustus TaxID=1609272 RepID=A0A5N8V829_9ACTN|nr:hypothetical protein [Streptomyces adustus]
MAATTVIAASGVLATASSASATVDPPSGGWDHTWTTTDAGKGGTIYIAEHGDIVTLCDTNADGRTPHLEVNYEDGPGDWGFAYALDATGGEGSCVSARASQGGRYDLPENEEIEIAIWLGPLYHEYGMARHYYLNDH